MIIDCMFCKAWIYVQIFSSDRQVLYILFAKLTQSKHINVDDVYYFLCLIHVQ